MNYNFLSIYRIHTQQENVEKTRSDNIVVTEVREELRAVGGRSRGWAQYAKILNHSSLRE